jgi:hypothetical protein
MPRFISETFASKKLSRAGYTDIKMINCFVRCLFIIFIVLPVHSIRAQSHEMIKVETFAGIRYQTIDGFGASDAWRVPFVGANWPLAKRNRIADLLFSREMDHEGNPKGIGLSCGVFTFPPERLNRARLPGSATAGAGDRAFRMPTAAMIGPVTQVSNGSCGPPKTAGWNDYWHFPTPPRCI